MKIVWVVLGMLLLAEIEAAPKMYRWEDETGKVFYSDKVPPEFAKQERNTLNEQGVVVDRVEAAKSEQERARDEEVEKKRAEQKRLADEQVKMDQVLLRTFRSEDDIIMSRNGKLSSIDAKIQLVRGNIRRLKRRLAEMQLSAANLERAGKPVPADMFEQIEAARQQINSFYQSIISQEEQKQQIREKYATDLARFRELNNIKAETGAAEVAKAGSNSMLETLVLCVKDCDELWRKAEGYVRAHATTPMQLLGKQIIMTRSPVAEEDISLAVSRIQRGGGIEEFFIDVQCKDSTIGDERCRSPEVQQIIAGFKELNGVPTAPNPPQPAGN